MPQPNHKKKKFQDPRVRKAISLSLDRWAGSKYLSKIAIVKTVGGIVFPKHPMAATKAELLKMPIFEPDNKKRRALAKKLLKEAGKSGMEFVLWNRAVDQPYKVVGTWMIDQWKQVGLKATQHGFAVGSVVCGSA